MNEDQLRESLLNALEECDMADAYIDELRASPWPPLSLAWSNLWRRVRKLA